jgi:F420-non-reducing hydrogenase iron-sulfur subunit
MTNDFEPNIIAFCCHYCAYAAADLAGSLRLEYPTAIKIVELPCTGKLDVLYVLRAFEDGADGVLVAGCLEGECHYLEGNLNARRRVEYAQKLLEQIGLQGRRVQMINLSSAMGGQFAFSVAELTAEIKQLGANPLNVASSVVDASLCVNGGHGDALPTEASAAQE